MSSQIWGSLRLPYQRLTRKGRDGGLEGFEGSLVQLTRAVSEEGCSGIPSIPWHEVKTLTLESENLEY